MKTDIAALASDKLIVTGKTEGSHTIYVQNSGSASSTGKEIVPLVLTADHDGSFTLGSDVRLGAWTYAFRQNTTDYGAGAGWELYGTGVLAPEADAALNTFIGSYLLSYAETNTLHQRLGDLRETPKLSGLWFRAHGGKFETDAGKVLNSFDMDYWGVQAGYDRKIENNWGGDLYAGLMFGYGKGDIDYPDGGEGEIESRMAGIYGTFIKPNGLYLDAVLKYMWIDNEFDVFDADGMKITGDDADTDGFGASLEVGQKISFKKTTDGGWYVEPQAQLSYQRFGSGYFTVSNGLRVGADSFSSLLGRLGLRIGYEKNNSNFYAKVSRVEEFDGKIKFNANGLPAFTEKLDEGWWVYGLGFTSRVNDRNSFYLDIERASGGYFKQTWAAKAGWRVLF